MRTPMPEDALNMLHTIAYCIWAFARRHQGDAYRFLRQYNGVQFLEEFYDPLGVQQSRFRQKI